MRVRILPFWLYASLSLGLVIGLFFLSQRLRLVDSEIWSFYQANNWNPFEGTLSGSFWKPFQVLVLRSLSIFSPVDVSMDTFLSTGRQFWTILFLVQLLLLIRISNRLHLSKQMQVFGAGLLFVSRYYLVEGLRVRADSLASIFMLIAIFELLRQFQHPSEKWASSVATISFAVLFGVLSTVKFIPQFVLLLFFGTLFFSNLRRIIVKSAAINLVLLLLGLVTISFYPAAWRILQSVLRSFWDAGLSFSEYRENFVFVLDQILFLFPFWLITGALLFQSLKTSTTDGKVNSFLACFALSHSLVVLLHPEPFPWYVASTVPLHVLCALRAVHSFGFDEWFKRKGLAVEALGLFLMILGFANAFRNFPGMKDQKQAIRDVSHLAHLFNVKSYYDNCGLISDIRHSIPFITATQNFDIQVAERMFRESPPDLIVETGRTVLLLPKVADLLESDYLRDPGNRGILIRKSLLNPQLELGRQSSKDPQSLFQEFDWDGDWNYGSLFSPYLGYKFVGGI